MTQSDYDFVVIGSGFGGSVSAYRLAQKGYKVCVLERGRRFNDDQLPKSNWHLRRSLWVPRLGLFGIQHFRFFKNLITSSWAAVGGGSLMYGGTLEQPHPKCFEDQAWGQLPEQKSWFHELNEHYATAKKMLGVSISSEPSRDDLLAKAAAKSVGATYRRSELGIFFGEPGELVPDPYFNGEGPSRRGCIQCGECLIGCRYNAKNTLVKNYLYLAEKLGVQVLAKHTVQNVCPDKNGGYRVIAGALIAPGFRKKRSISTKNVIFSAGTLGTVELLMRCQKKSHSLPKISKTLGLNVRTNHETLVFATQTHPPQNDVKKTAMSSAVHLKDGQVVEPFSYPKKSDLPSLFVMENEWVDRVMSGWTIFKWPRLLLHFIYGSAKKFLQKTWAARTHIFLVMKPDQGPKFKVTLRHLGLTPFDSAIRLERMNQSSHTITQQTPTELDRFVATMTELTKDSKITHRIGSKKNKAKKNNVTIATTWAEQVFGIPISGHILGGVLMGASPNDSVIDTSHRIHGYKGLYVCDGSVIQGDLGMNPSLTIVAMTERAMSKIPAKRL